MIKSLLTSLLFFISEEHPKFVFLHILYSGTGKFFTYVPPSFCFLSESIHSLFISGKVSPLSFLSAYILFIFFF